MSEPVTKPSVRHLLIGGLMNLLRWIGRLLWPPLRVAFSAGVRIGYRDIVTTSSHLSYLTIFGLVPLLVLILAIMGPLGLLGDTHRGLQTFLTRTGISTIEVPITPLGSQGPSTQTVPSSVTVNLGATIQEIVEDVLERLTVQRVGPIGILVLAWAAISLVTTLEKALNSIFGAQTRPFAHRFLLYWSVATLVPIIIAAAVFGANRAVAHIEQYTILSYIVSAIVYVGPTIVGIFIAALIYKFLSNTHVDFEASLIGAAVAVPIWVVAKRAFQLYLHHAVLSGSLYGMLGLLPIFLVWLNMSWLIFLWGAQLAHARQHGGRVWIEKPGDISLKPQPADLLAVALEIGRYFQAGLGAITLGELARTINLPQGNIQELLRYLEKRNLVVRKADQEQARYLLGKPPERISVLDAFGVDTTRDLDYLITRYNTANAGLILQAQHRALRDMGSYTLADLLNPDEPHP